MSALDLSLLTATIDHVSTHLPDKLEEAGQASDPLYEKLQILAHIREERKRLQLSEAIVEAQCAQAMGRSDAVDYPDLYATRRGGTWTRKAWEHDTMRSRIATCIAVDPHTGEYDGEKYADVLELLYRFADLVSVSGYKVKGLAAAGIEFDDACTREPGRRTVEVQRGSRDDVVETAAVA